jgi:hypothetical protein
MQSTQFNTLAAGRRVQGFVGRHAAALTGIMSPVVQSKLDTAVTQLADYQSEQEMTDALISGEARNQARLRLDVYENFLKPIALVAGDELTDKTQFPQMNLQAVVVRNADFVSKASAAIAGAALYPAVMIDHGLAADFVAQAEAAIAEVTASADASAAHRSRRYTATLGIAKADAAVRKAISMIDGFLRRGALKSNTDVMDDWQASKHIKQAPVNAQPTGSLVIGSSTTAPQSPAPAGPALVESAPATPAVA